MTELRFPPGTHLLGARLVIDREQTLLAKLRVPRAGVSRMVAADVSHPELWRDGHVDVPVDRRNLPEWWQPQTLPRPTHVRFDRPGGPVLEMVISSDGAEEAIVYLLCFTL
ncbi:MAG: hypothetical protein HY321_07985 [Armatimonadetes bacterium]|nr:hypothetical protein [Armatimonadota bacterium]